MVSEEIIKKFKVTIGLEVHAQLLTQSKMFAPESAENAVAPNTQLSAISLAHPGTLPRINQQAISLAVLLGLACGSTIGQQLFFDRKHYFYPDLPKGYQLTQDKTPLCKGGALRIKTAAGQQTVALKSIHLEEDSGKSIHQTEQGKTLLDFNRAGMPLAEIVTQPVIASAEEANSFLTELRRLMRYLEICDGNMEEGSLRCDVNISLKPHAVPSEGQRVEVKNLNSFNHVKKAINHEIERQAALLLKGARVEPETRGFDAGSGSTFIMRKKEALQDYHYFPEPDLSPFLIAEAFLEKLRQRMPPLPWELEQRFCQVYGLSDYDVQLLTEDKETARYFEALCVNIKHYKAAANWLAGPVKKSLQELNCTIKQFPVLPLHLSALLRLVEEGQLSYTAASQGVYPVLLQNPQADPLQIAREANLLQERNNAVLQGVIEQLLKEYPAKVASYRGGKKGIFGMFMGELMKRTGGKADPRLASGLLQQALEL